MPRTDNEFKIPPKKYHKIFPSYLQNDGTSHDNKITFMYDLINEYKNRLVEFWNLFDLDALEAEYIKWRESKSTIEEGVKTYPEDAKWVYTGFLENLCKSYQITRDYFSPYANDPNNFHEGYVPPGNSKLNNLNMIRLLKISRTSVGFDGSRENLRNIIQTALTNRTLDSGASDLIEIFMRTKTEEGEHASLQVYYIVPEDKSIWSDTDTYLAMDGKYFVELLGIELDIEVTTKDILIYDSGEYSDKNSSNPENEPNLKYK